MKRLLIPLNSPLKRAAALVLAVGLAWLAAAFILDLADHEYGGLQYRLNSATERISDALFGSKYERAQYWYFRWALAAIVAGLAFSYLYDQGIGRIVRWVKG